jgi:hypothetical protein
MGGGKPDQTAARQAAQSQADIGKELVGFSKQIWGESAPYRKQTGDFWSSIIKGGPEGARAVAPQINQATQQFSLARKATKDLPPGGLRDISLRNLDIAEAGAKTGIYSGGVNEALTRLANQANMGTQAGISGLSQGSQSFGGAANTYTNLAQMGAQSLTGMFGGLGSLVAMV